MYPIMTAGNCGYLITLKDDTGAAIANKSVYCSTTSKSYTTDANGTINEVIYVPTITQLQFELTGQPWSDGTYHLNWTISGGEDAKTNVVSVNGVRTYDGCAYTITFRNYDNSLWSNKSVYCTTNSKTYYTNGSGQVSFIAAQTSLSFRIDSGTSTSISYGIITTTPYNSIGSVTGTSGVLNTRTVTGNYNATGSSTSKINQNVPALGDTMTIGSYEYVVVHIESSIVYAILKYWQEDIQYNPNGDTTYAGSNIANRCTTWYNNIPSQWRVDANAFISVVTEGVDAACFIPTYHQTWGPDTSNPQITTGFDYFTSTDHRIFIDSSGDGHAWWTSTTYEGVNYVVIIGANGDRSGIMSNPALTHGFRPVLAIKQSAFLNG